MSSSTLIPIAIVIICLLVVLLMSLSGREKSESKIFQLRIPQKRRKKKPPVDKSNSELDEVKIDRQALSKWHIQYERDLLQFFEVLDSIILRRSDRVEDEVKSHIFSAIEEASLKHPSAVIGAELTAMIGSAESTDSGSDRNGSDYLSHQQHVYENYRLIWLSRIRQYVDDRERLIRLQKQIR